MLLFEQRRVHARELIPRCCDPSQGFVSIDGQDVREVTIRSLDEGRIVQRGTHDELVDLGGLDTRMRQLRGNDEPQERGGSPCGLRGT